MPEFLADGTPGHRLPDDPIVRPVSRARPHSHDFNANSTYQSLLGKTGTRKPDIDISSCWAPILDKGQ